MYRLNFYVPEANLEEVKEALFECGAGKIGNYEKCCWQTKGTGQFLPNEGSNPTIGEVGNVEVLAEYKVEMMCKGESINTIIKKLLEVHPYEEPAYDLVKVVVKKDLL